MDQLSAHLDRGWDLAQHGDARGAEAAARSALAIDSDAPEAHNLLGYAAAMSGEPEEALEHYRHALALDEGYFDAMLNAAEVMLAPIGDLDGSVEMCDEALTWAETDEETADALLLKIDALLGKDDEEGAKRALRMIPAGPFEGDRFDFAIGRAAFELGDLDRAEPFIERALTKDADDADARYYRALIREARGDVRSATVELLKVRGLDALDDAKEWAPTTAAFEALVRTSIAALDPALRRFVSEADVFVLPLPGLEAVADGVDPRAPLLVDGIATPERPGPPCARLFFYERNVERPLRNAEDLPAEITAILEHEIAATFLEPRREDGARAPRPKHELN
ncbi:MAG: tetratricopeptide repeat protein [Polyangiales bacterium]